MSETSTTREAAPWVAADDGRVMHFGIQHVVARTRTWTTPNGVTLTEWEARCGSSDTRTGGDRELRHGGTRDRLKRAACRSCEGR